MGKILTTDLVVGTLVSVALLAAIFLGQTELAGNIASGLIGYLGRTITERRTEGSTAARLAEPSPAASSTKKEGVTA